MSVPLLINKFKGQLRPCGDGAFDTHFASMSKELVALGLGKAIIRLGWEMNGNWFPWYTGTAAQEIQDYKNCYRNVVRVLRATPGQSYVFDWNPNLGSST